MGKRQGKRGGKRQKKTKQNKAKYCPKPEQEDTEPVVYFSDTEDESNTIVTPGAARIYQEEQRTIGDRRRGYSARYRRSNCGEDGMFMVGVVGDPRRGRRVAMEVVDMGPFFLLVVDYTS